MWVVAPRYKSYYVTKSQRLAAILHRLRVNDTKHLQETLRTMKASVLARRDKGRARNEPVDVSQSTFTHLGALEWGHRPSQTLGSADQISAPLY